MALETIFFAENNQPSGPFCGLLTEYILGKITSAQVKSYAEEITGAFTADQTTDFDSIISDIDGATGNEAKFVVAKTLEDVLSISMWGGYTYCSGAEALKTRMGWI